MKEAATDILDKIKEFTSNNPAAVGGTLAAALGGGALGATLSSRGRMQDGESKQERRRRITRDAILMAAAGGGATALGIAGVNQLANALPKGDVDPISGILRHPGGRATIGGTLGTMAYGYNKSRVEPGRASAVLRDLIHANPVIGEVYKDTPTGQALKVLKSLASTAHQPLDRAFSSLSPYSISEASKLGINAPGIPQHGITQRLPELLRSKLDDVRGIAREKIPGLAKVLDRTGVQKALGSTSRFMYRHPGVTAAAIAGATIPEWSSVVNTVLDPAMPNPLSRE